MQIGGIYQNTGIFGVMGHLGLERFFLVCSSHISYHYRSLMRRRLISNVMYQVHNCSTNLW